MPSFRTVRVPSVSKSKNVLSLAHVQNVLDSIQKVLIGKHLEWHIEYGLRMYAICV